MKAASATKYYRYYAPRVGTPKPYPNAADRRITVEKVVDTLLAAAITLSVITVLLVLLAMG